MQKSVYTNKEWATLINQAISFLREESAADGTWSGSLKEFMTIYANLRPEVKITGGSLAAILPMTGLVERVGRTAKGNSIWRVKEGSFTADDWTRIVYLRKELKAGQALARRQAKEGSKPTLVRQEAPKQEARIDETLTGKPAIVVSPVHDYKRELEEARAKNSELWDRAQALEQKVQELEEASERDRAEYVTSLNDLYERLGEASRAFAEVNELQAILRNVSVSQVAYNAFKAGLKIGSETSQVFPEE